MPGYGHETGPALGLHPDVDVIAFTGSTAVGKKLLKYSSRSSMEAAWLQCSGKSANIVFADLDSASDHAITGVFNCSGQVSSANSRLLVESSIVDDLIEGVAVLTRAIRVGDSVAPETRMVLLVSAAQLATCGDISTPPDLPRGS